MDDNFDFDDSPAGDIRRWHDVVSHQLERLEENLRDERLPRSLTPHGEIIVRRLSRIRGRLSTGERINGDYIRRLLDIVMNSSSTVYTPLSSLTSARPQERAETETRTGAAAAAAPK